MTDRKKTRGDDRPYGSTPLGGASTTGPLAGAMILSDELAADPTGPVRAAIELLEKTRQSFKSKDVARAREILDGFVDQVLPPLPEPEPPDGPVALRLDDALGRDVVARGDVVAATIKRDLGRYYALVHDELADIPITLKEVGVLHAVLMAKNTMEPPRLLRVEVEDYLARDRARTEHPERDGVLTGEEAAALLEALRQLSPAAITALVDAMERFGRLWPQRERDMGRALRRVGFFRGARFGYGGPQKPKSGKS